MADVQRKSTKLRKINIINLLTANCCMKVLCYTIYNCLISYSCRFSCAQVGHHRQSEIRDWKSQAYATEVDKKTVAVKNEKRTF